MIKFTREKICSSPSRLAELGIERSDFHTTTHGAALFRASRACKICPAQGECLDGYLAESSSLPAGVYAGFTSGDIRKASRMPDGLDQMRRTTLENLAKLAADQSRNPES